MSHHRTMKFYKKCSANLKFKDHREDVLLLGNGNADTCKREMEDEIVGKEQGKTKWITIAIRVVRGTSKTKNICRGCIGNTMIKWWDFVVEVFSKIKIVLMWINHSTKFLRFRAQVSPNLVRSLQLSNNFMDKPFKDSFSTINQWMFKAFKVNNLLMVRDKFNLNKLLTILFLVRNNSQPANQCLTIHSNWITKVFLIMHSFLTVSCLQGKEDIWLTIACLGMDKEIKSDIVYDDDGYVNNHMTILKNARIDCLFRWANQKLCVLIIELGNKW